MVDNTLAFTKEEREKQIRKVEASLLLFREKRITAEALRGVMIELYNFLAEEKNKINLEKSK